MKCCEHAKAHRPDVLTKTSLMLGLGERDKEIMQTMDDLRAANVDILTLGQYLRPTPNHLAVERYVTPDEFNAYRQEGLERGFRRGRRRADGAFQLSCRAGAGKEQRRLRRTGLIIMEFVAEYGLFLLKVATIVIAIVVIIIVASAASRKGHAGRPRDRQPESRSTARLRSALRKAVMKKSEQKQEEKDEKKRLKDEEKQDFGSAAHVRHQLQGRPARQRGTVIARGSQRSARRCDARRSGGCAA